MTGSQSPFDDPGFLADPYPFYHRLRSADPVHWLPTPSPLGGMWLVTRYEDAAGVLKDRRLSKDPAKAMPAAAQTQDTRSMLFRDPPDHTRLRAMVADAFTPKVVAGLRPHIEEITNYLLERVESRGEMDVIADLALPLPVIVIAELLGVPEDDREKFRTWSEDVIQGSDAAYSDEQRRQRSEQANIELAKYFQDLVGLRREVPQDDLISRLIEVEDSQGKLSEQDLIATCVLLVIAGHETTVNLLGNGTLALLRHPDQLEWVRADVSLIPNAIEEMLRYDSPVQRATFRCTTEPVEIGERLIEPDQQVSAVIGAANRDPEQFPDPDRFEVKRTPNRHLAFGRGVHFCLGASLARTEGEIAFRMLLERLPELELAVSTPTWRANTVFRGLRELPVRF